MNNTLLSKFISGANGFLNIINQIIPLYDEFKPVIQKFISIKDKINISSFKNTNKKEEDKVNISSSSPQFFL